MNVQRFALISLFFAANAFAADATYKIDGSHSYIGFKVKHLGISNVKGQFTKYEGTGSFDEKTGKVSNIKVTIDASSVDTREADRDKHLRNSDFFDVDKFKDIKFESTNVVTKNNKPTEIHGKFTLRGVTKDIKLTVTEWGGTTTDPWGNEKVGFTATGKINRQEFGVSWNKPIENKDLKDKAKDKAKEFAVGNDVELTIEIEANKDKTKVTTN